MKIFNKNLNIDSDDVFKCQSKKTLNNWKLRVENDILSMETQITVLEINGCSDSDLRSVKAAKVMQEMLLSQINKQLSIVKTPLEKFVEDIVNSDYELDEIIDAIKRGKDESRK